MKAKRSRPWRIDDVTRFSMRVPVQNPATALSVARRGRVAAQPSIQAKEPENRAIDGLLGWRYSCE